MHGYPLPHIEVGHGRSPARPLPRDRLPALPDGPTAGQVKEDVRLWYPSDEMWSPVPLTGPFEEGI